MSQERLKALAILSIEQNRARKVDFNTAIDTFAEQKARKKHFWSFDGIVIIFDVELLVLVSYRHACSVQYLWKTGLSLWLLTDMLLWVF